MSEPRHCDDYIDDPTAPDVLRKFLEHVRSPGHGFYRPDPRPKLFATYRGEPWLGVEPGDRVRVMMASRLGDLGITKNLEAKGGYDARCFVEQLSDFGDAP